MTPAILGGRYQLGERLGEGTLSEVFAAEDQQLHRRVAIKLLRAPLAQDANISERFSSEARRTSRLSHPNIVSIYDVGREGEQAYIVMELVEGKSLRTYVDEQAPFDLQDVLTVVNQIADALDYAHGHGVFHRDLNPRNVLITEEGRIKLTDFGLARGDGAAIQGTLGPASYLAPEQVEGARLNAGVDIYALGVMTFEMLTGRLPFRGETPLEIASRHLNAAPPAPSRFNAKLSRQVDVTVVKALAKTASQRFATASDFAETLALARPRQESPPASPQSTVRMPVVASPAVGAVPQQTTGDPLVMLPLPAPPNHRRRSLAGWLVGAAGALLVIYAFLLTERVMSSTPLAGIPDFANPSGVNLRIPTPAPGSSTRPAANPRATATVLLSEQATPTPGTPEATDTATPTDTPAPTDTAVPAAPAVTSAPAPAAPTAAPTKSSLVSVPDVVGQTEAAAQSAIAAAGLKTTFPNYQTFTSQPPGHVLSQTPAGGSRVPPGTTIYIAVRR